MNFNFNKNNINELLDKITFHLSTLRDKENKYAVLVPDGRLIPNRDFTFWEWTSGVGLYGMMRWYKISHDQKYLDIILDWFQQQENKEIEKNINTMVQILTVCNLYELNHDPKWLAMIEEWGQWLTTELPRTAENGFQHVVYASVHENQLWTDTLMMSALTIGKIGKILNHQPYIDEAKYQFLLHAKYLFDKKEHLWYHGWTFNENSNFSGAFWGRGNAWPLIAIPEMIEILELSKSDPLVQYFENILKNHILKIVELQDEKTGLWHTLLNDPTSYLETSCTAGFAYGIQLAMKRGLISEKYQVNVEKAIAGLLNNLTAEGALLNVSGGTPVFNDLDKYKEVIVGDYPYGQSMAILALSEYAGEKNDC